MDSRTRELLGELDREQRSWEQEQARKEWDREEAEYWLHQRNRREGLS